MEDIRDILFQEITNKQFKANLTIEKPGILAGTDSALEKAAQLGIDLTFHKNSGDIIHSGDVIGTITAAPKAMAIAEETIIGSLAKASGIASAAKSAVEIARDQIRIVSGSWKKMPPETKNLVRQAVICGGAYFRICDEPMIYLDKNFIRMLGSIKQALEAAAAFKDHIKVIQIRGLDQSVTAETKEAVDGGSRLLMVDTGKPDDLETCLTALESLGMRNQVRVAFAGNVRLTTIPSMLDYDIDVLCIGKDIVDARLLDMKLDVI